MRRVLWGALIAVAATACSSPSTSGDTKLPDEQGSPSVQGSGEISLTLGQEKPALGTVLHVTFTRVVGDSRCAVDVVCVHAGNGEVELGIRMGTGPTHALRLNTMDEPKSTIWNNVRVTLLELTPEPRTNPPHDTSAYAVRLRLEAL